MNQPPQAPRQRPQDPHVSAQLPPGDPKTLESFLSGKGAQERLAQIATGFMKPVELTRLALVAVSKTPDLLKCSQASILRALIDAATLRIVPGGTMGRGYLVPRKNKNTGRLEASFDPGWRGLADIARRSGQVIGIDAQVVYKADHFKYIAGTDKRIEHEPNLEATDLGPIIAAYAVAIMKDGPPQLEVLRRSDIDRIHEVSAAKAGPWANWFDEMARKSAVRRLCKYLPYDPELERAVQVADDVETGITTTLDLSDAEGSLEDELAARDAAAAGAGAPPPAVEPKALPEKTTSAAQAVGLDQPQRQPETVSAAATAGDDKTKTASPARVPPEDAPAKATPAKSAKAEAKPAQAPAQAKDEGKPDAPPAPTAGPPASDDAPGMNPDSCVVCKKAIDWDRDGVPTKTPEGRKAYRHEACKPDPFGVGPAAT